MPIGGVLACKEVIVPNAVGVDIGCGMCAIKTSLNAIEKSDLQKIVDLIAEMKNVSKTGATGFGSLNKEELKVLQDASTALELGTPKEEAKVYLDNMEAAARKIINGSQKISTPQSLQPTDFQNFDKIPMPEFDAAQRIKNLKSKYGLN